jgi:predicted dehydrogenase
VVLVTASSNDDGPIRQAAEASRRKGRVVVVGAVGMNLPREPFYIRELELRLSMSYGPGRYDPSYEEGGQDYPYAYVRWTENRNMAEFLALLAAGKLNVRRLTSHRFPIADGERAYGLMMEGKEPYLGILLDYPGMEAAPERRRIELATGKKRERLGVGLIGAGNHVKDMLLPPLRRVQGVEIRGVCTGTGANARQLADKLGASFCTADYRDVLADPEIDAVLIGTRHGGHGAQVVGALEAGKHVFVEKPLCLTEEELARIEEIYPARARAGQRLMVGFNRRFSPHAGKARDFLRDRRNPLVMTYRVNAGPIPATHWIQDPEAGGGRILGEACHFVDFMTSLTGALPVHVQARSIGHHASGLTDDQCVIMLGFADGSVGTILYAADGDAALEKEYFEAFGDGRSITLRDYQLTECYVQRRRERFRTRTRDKGFAAEMAAFAGDILEARPPSMPFEQIAAVTRACLLAVKSLRTGEPYGF